jgi:cytochrome bd-type quinol oxidase subunit 1
MEIIAELLTTFFRVLIVDILLGTVFYCIGWFVCKVTTFGRFPHSIGKSNDKNRNLLVSLIGVATSLAVFLSFIYWV